jgi:hypothetical protein
MKKFKIIILILISLLLISCNISDIKNKVSSIFSKDKKDDMVTSDFSEEKKDNKILRVTEEEIITDINDEQKLFRTTLGEGTYAYIASNSNENVIEGEIKIDLDGDGQKEEVVFGDSEDGLYFNYYNPTKDKFQFLLSNDLSQNPEEVNYYFDNGETRKEVSYQITPLDLDNDGIKEIILSAYDTTDFGIIHSFIWKKINENYQYIGNIEGQTYMYFDKDTQSIIVPIGSQGLYQEYMIENSYIVELSKKIIQPSNTTLTDSNYGIFKSDKFNYSLEYPNKNFKIVSETNDGIDLESNDSKASINCYITKNTSNDTIKSMYEDNMDFIGIEIPYKKLGEDFYVLSYIKNGYIEYAKVIYNKKNNTFIQLRFYYLEDYKEIMNPIIERMTKSLKY